VTVQELRDLLDLDIADAARLHDCQTTACPICDALERLGDT